MLLGCCGPCFLALERPQNCRKTLLRALREALRTRYLKPLHLVNLFLTNLVRISGLSSLFAAIAVFLALSGKMCWKYCDRLEKRGKPRNPHWFVGKVGGQNRVALAFSRFFPSLKGVLGPKSGQNLGKLGSIWHFPFGGLFSCFAC